MITQQQAPRWTNPSASKKHPLHPHSTPPTDHAPYTSIYLYRAQVPPYWRP